MNISIISASHRKNSQSNRVAKILEKQLQKKFKVRKILSMSKRKAPSIVLEPINDFKTPKVSGGFNVIPLGWPFELTPSLLCLKYAKAS